tara:strand:+ start:1412 stop:2206 length:795 start_codon:yes stop_codon:yes gene_type:complete
MRENITIIGAGSLTVSILEGIKESEVSYDINIVDIDKKRASFLRNFDIRFSTEYNSDISKSNIILLLTKPKDYARVIKSIDPYISDHTIILSFMAGIKIKQIEKMFSRKIKVVRCMTNLAISVGQSYLFYFMSKSSKMISNKLNKFLSSFSVAKRCARETSIDKLTALYGSGPAYYIFFNDIVKNSFIQMGFTKKESELYTSSLMLGSTKLLDKNDSLDLLKSIASKGGTTEAALSQLKKDKVDKNVDKAIQQAYMKSLKILEK